MSMKATLKSCLIVSMFLLVVVSPTMGQIIYVDVGATGNNDGLSWADAYKYLQDALAEASEGDQIWVAEGTYKPDQGKNVRKGDRNATFQLKSGVEMYGGFPSGGGEWEDNDPAVYKTILSGDLKGDDGELTDPKIPRDSPVLSDNSEHVLLGNRVDRTAVLDGFTITGGMVKGGGIFIESGSPTIRNCTFIRNYSDTSGGAMTISLSSSPLIVDCDFINNSAKWSGAINNYSKYPRFINCLFEGNTANSGGAVFNTNGGCDFISCTFIANKVARSGGAMLNYYCRANVVDCVFANNTAGWGGAINNFMSKAMISNNLFIGNHSSNNGGGILNQGANPKISNCNFIGNFARVDGGGVCSDPLSEPSLTNCILWHNKDGGGLDESAQIWGEHAIVNYSYVEGLTGDLGGTGNIALDPLFVKPGHWDPNGTEGPNDDFWVEGDWHLLQNSPCIDAGDPKYKADPNAVDFDGDKRCLDGNNDGQAVVDIGIDEF